MDRIKKIYLEHSQRYGYRRIYGQLRSEGYEINHKKVQRLMQKMGLFGISIRKRRKYSSYYSVQGKMKPDLIKRNFYAIIPDRHWFTDVTEFHLKDQKLYFLLLLQSLIFMPKNCFLSILYQEKTFYCKNHY